MNKDTTPTTQTDEELREELIDKLDDQRMGDNVVNKKLLYKDIEWIIDELLPVIKSHREEYADKQVKEVLENLEPLTHNGRGTILWEMDVLCDALNEELARLSKKDPKVTEKSVGNPKFGKVS